MRVNSGNLGLSNGLRKRCKPAFGFPLFRVRTPNFREGVAVDESADDASTTRHENLGDLPAIVSDYGFGERQNDVLVDSAVSLVAPLHGTGFPRTLVQRKAQAST